MYRNFSDSDDDYIDDGGGDFDGLFRRHHNNSKEIHFLSIIRSVIEYEKKTLTSEDEEILFSKINLHLMKPFSPLGILTLQRLAYTPSTVSAERLNKIANIICLKVFNPLTVSDDEILVYVDFCKAFAYLKATTHEGVVMTFEQVLINTFIDELSKKFGYAQRLEYLLVNRDIPYEKKQKWLNRQFEEQQQSFKIMACKSVSFLDKLYQLYSEIVYRVIEFLLRSKGEDRFQYLHYLVNNVRFHDGRLDETFEADVTNIYKMKMFYWERNQDDIYARFPRPPMAEDRKDLTHLFESINMLSRADYSLTRNMRHDIQNRITEGNNMKGNCPQDYIKYCIKDYLLSEKSSVPLDDFEIDDEGDYDCSLYNLRSKNLTTLTLGKTRPYGTIIWKGLKVKILKKKSENKPVRNMKFR